MVLSALTLGGGLLLGLASSLHCAGMCGPIAASLMFGFGPSRTRALAAAQAGRVLGLVLAGALAGPRAAALYGGLRTRRAFLVMRVGGGAVAGLDRLFAAGPRPSLAVVDRPRRSARPRVAACARRRRVRRRHGLGLPALRHGLRRAVLRRALGRALAARRLWRVSASAPCPPSTAAALGPAALPLARARAAGARRGRARADGVAAASLRRRRARAWRGVFCRLDPGPAKRYASRLRERVAQ